MPAYPAAGSPPRQQAPGYPPAGQGPGFPPPGQEAGFPAAQQQFQQQPPQDQTRAYQAAQYRQAPQLVPGAGEAGPGPGQFGRDQQFGPYPPAGPGAYPPGDYGTPPEDPPAGPPRQPPRRHDRDRPVSSAARWVLLLAVVLVAAVAAILVTHPFSHPTASTASPGSSPGTAAAAPSGGGPSGTASAATSTAPARTASPSTAPGTEQQAATRVSVMLAKSVSDRSAVSGAAADVAACGPNLTADKQAFSAAAASRQALLASLKTVPGQAKLPASLLSQLTAAWQASVSADQAYAQWAGDESAKGCVRNDTSDPGYQAATTADSTATKDKAAFTTAWNPVAARYRLTSYQPGQL
jgi:hypothetical protein